MILPFNHQARYAEIAISLTDDTFNIRLLIRPPQCVKKSS